MVVGGPGSGDAAVCERVAGLVGAGVAGFCGLADSRDTRALGTTEFYAQGGGGGAWYQRSGLKWF